jgi:5-methylcytosine-specific restriction endonuclease McrA
MGKQRKVIKVPNEPYHRDGRPVKFKIGNGTRKVIIKRDGYICRYCGAELTPETHTIDHVIPASENGNEDARNLVMCCSTCNKRARNLVFSSFEAKKQYLLENRIRG